MPQVAVAERPPQGRRTPYNPDDAPLAPRQVIEVMAGLLAGLFTAMLSSTIVATALPTIVGALHGTQRSYTWVITAALLASTVSTPIWGKLADLFNKKLLVQLGLVLFVLASVGAGFAKGMGFLIAMRVVQGIGMGGLTALTQAVMGSIIPPRERGKYSGLMGGVMAVSTVGGPLLGGVLVDSALGWRWCYFVCVPLAVVALIMLQRTLHLHEERRKPRIDYLGALLISVGASLPLLWVTFAGKDYGWWSLETCAFLGGSALALALAVVVELRHPEPMVPLRKLASRNTVLILIASIAVGIGMFAATTFITQYFQIARGFTPTHSGLLTIPLVGAMLVSSTGTGFAVSRTGKWKGFLLAGAVMLTGGLFGLSTADHATAIWQLGICMAIMGAGVGAMMQNLVLAVQNSVDVRDIGAVSSVVAFFRSLGGAIGVSVLGAILANRVSELVARGIVATYGPKAVAQGGAASADTLDLTKLPPPIVAIVRHAYGDATGHIFWVAAFVSIATIVMLLFVKEVPLRTTVRKLDDVQPARSEPGAGMPDSLLDGRPVEVPVPAAADPAYAVPAPVVTAEPAPGPPRAAGSPAPSERPSPRPRRATPESLRAYELTLGGDGAGADSVLAAAQDEATRIIASAQERAAAVEARTRAELDELERRIGRLRRTEQELRGRLDGPQQRR